ncbi:PspC domain-containing protein [Sphingobium sp. CR28]|uniref:PspC domain-containing protein n=1 Tax=Sphingobium sp. CR28 TaxID=3400272 RepID=UPI003FED7628
MTDPQPHNLFARGDTIFGVCEAIGQDFGFNPNWLRVAFAVPLLYSPVVAIASYAGIGAIVAISRVVFPRKVSDSLVPAEEAPSSEVSAPVTRGEITEVAYAHAA